MLLQSPLPKWKTWFLFLFFFCFPGKDILLALASKSKPEAALGFLKPPGCGEKEKAFFTQGPLFSAHSEEGKELESRTFLLG